MYKKIMKELLSSLCGSSRASYGPFSAGEYSYATNGFVMIRVPRLDDVAETETPPYHESLPWDHGYIGGWVARPVFDFKDADKCRSCNGTGHTSECPECEGEGEVLLENDFNEYEVECKTFEGAGFVAGGDDQCDNCVGSGISMSATVKWERGFLWAKMLLLISVLPCLMLSTYGVPLSAVRFKFDGGVGLLMPCRDPGDGNV